MEKTKSPNAIKGFIKTADNFYLRTLENVIHKNNKKPTKNYVFFVGFTYLPI